MPDRTVSSRCNIEGAGAVKLIAKAFINHHIQIEDHGGTLKVRLTDESGGLGEFVDTDGVFRELGEGNRLYLAPLQSGGSTPCSPAEIAWILDHVPMTVEKFNQWSEHEDEWISIPHLFLPKDMEQRTELLAAHYDDVRRIERIMEDNAGWAPPEWFRTLEALRADPGPTLFSAP